MSFYGQHPCVRELWSLSELSKLEGTKLYKATSTTKSALEVLRGQKKASISRTTGVTNPTGDTELNIPCTHNWFNSSAPTNVIADVEPLQLRYASGCLEAMGSSKWVEKPIVEDQDEKDIHSEDLAEEEQITLKELETTWASISRLG